MENQETTNDLEVSTESLRPNRLERRKTKAIYKKLYEREKQLELQLEIEDNKIRPKVNTLKIRKKLLQKILGKKK